MQSDESWEESSVLFTLTTSKHNPQGRIKGTKEMLLSWQIQGHKLLQSARRRSSVQRGFYPWTLGMNGIPENEVTTVSFGLDGASTDPSISQC